MEFCGADFSVLACAVVIFCIGRKSGRVSVIADEGVTPAANDVQ